MNKTLKNLESLSGQIKLSVEDKNSVESLIMAKVSEDLETREGHSSTLLRFADK